MKELGVEEIISVFRDLGLRVCDDQTAIEDKVKATEPRYARLRNRPERAVYHKWTEDVDKLQNDRGPVLEKVYEKFANLADVALASNVSTGATKLTQALATTLRTLLMDQCYVDSALADRFLDRFYQERNLVVGDDLIRTPAVENFQAKSYPDRIALTWTNPTAPFDTIEILREEETPTNAGSTGSRLVYQGKETSCSDIATPGRWYRYRARVQVSGVTGVEMSDRGIRVGEVPQKGAKYESGNILVSWTLPDPNSSIVVFRREGDVPEITVGANGPTPKNKQTTRIDCGNDTSWTDSGVQEGKTYHYSIVVDYGSGFFSKGVTVSATVPIAPPPPRNVVAQHEQSDRDNSVVLKWEAPPGGASFEYVVVQRKGSTPPSGVNDGKEIVRTAHRTARDTTVLAGHRYSYSVFSNVGGSMSRVGASPRPIDILPEVTKLITTPVKTTIELSWETPANVKKVVVRRGSTPPKSVSDGMGISLLGPQNARDDHVAPETRYHYLVCCVYSPDGINEITTPGVPSSTIIERRIQPREVQQAEAHFENGTIRVSWTALDKGASIVLFRKEGGSPEVVPHPGGPEPKDSGTTKIECGKEPHWIDHHVQEGKTYYYSIVVDYGWGTYSKGVEVRATVPRLPPKVPALAAKFESVDGDNAVFLQWKPAPGKAPFQYVLLRRKGATPPSSIKKEETIAVTDHLQWHDTAVVAGERYSYTVFAKVGGLHSREGMSSPPVDILAEVTNLETQPGKDTIELSWERPTNVKDVLVRREFTPPRDSTDGVQVKLVDPQHARDESVPGNKECHYLVCCVYRTDGTRDVITPGVRVADMIVPNPEEVTNFSAGVRGGAVVCSWDLPRRGDVIVLRSDRPHSKSLEDIFNVAELKQMGERLPGTTKNEATDTNPDFQRPFYSSFSVLGKRAMVGPTRTCILCTEVSKLRVTPTHTGATLRWEWPKSCQSVVVARRKNQFPVSHDDPDCSPTTYTKTQYEENGNKYVDSIHQEKTNWHYVVFARVVTDSGVFYSSGSDPGCRATLNWSPHMTLQYSLSSANDSTKEDPACWLTCQTRNAGSNAMIFELLANRDHVPRDISDGVVLHTLRVEKGRQRVWLSLVPIKENGWRRFYYKLIPQDPSVSANAMIVHPNLSKPVTSLGKVPVSHPPHPVAHTKEEKVKTIVCPICFEDFSSDNILYGDSEGNEFQRIHHGLWKRLLKKPKQQPVDSKGKALRYKYCPNQHRLPRTAGTQPSFVLGMIGAKHSGKTHFVASLVKRIRDQVGSDFHAALSSLTDNTDKRYEKEFHNPLFKKHLELAVTVGTPDPLIYELQMGDPSEEESQDQSITLSFYDTSGENFQDRKLVEQMVKYLRVASGVILLIDPLEFSSVQQSLPQQQVPPSVHDSQSIVDRVLEELENNAILKANERLTVPAAVVLTKCDVLADAGLIEPHRLWSSTERHVEKYDWQLHEDTSGMFEELIQRWSPNLHGTVTQRFTHRAFFGVSATGCAPNPKSKRYDFVSPWRVEDPLLWLLAQTGVIPCE